MSDLWQTLGVAVAVAAAACYLAMQWMPARWRRGVAERVAAGSRRLGLRDAQADRLAQGLARKGGCGSCDSCGACGTAAGAGPAAGDGAGAGADDGTGRAPAAAGRPGVAVPLVRHPRRG